MIATDEMAEAAIDRLVSFGWTRQYGATSTRLRFEMKAAVQAALDNAPVTGEKAEQAAPVLTCKHCGKPIVPYTGGNGVLKWAHLKSGMFSCEFMASP